MSHRFVDIMATILGEANAGAFTTKGSVIDRRDELLRIDRRDHQAVPAEPTEPAAPADTASHLAHDEAAELATECGDSALDVE